MKYTDLLVLIPGHSLEDFPVELGEKPAEGLLNAFAVIWHPVLLAQTDIFPRWERADELNEVVPTRLVIVPTACADQVPSAFIERARREGMNLVTGITDRQEMIDAVLKPLDEVPDINPEIVADFLALGHLYLQCELLTRAMRQWGNIDEAHMQREAAAGAKAAIDGDDEAARTHLRHCFEMLHEARERFYPVECHLIDMCLIIPRLADEKFERLLNEESSRFSLMTTVKELEQIITEHPEYGELLRRRMEAGTVDFVGGDYIDRATPMLSLSSIIGELKLGHETLQRLLGCTPKVWGRRRYGVGPQMPQLLKRLGYEAALHLVLDDGLYPDQEFAKLEWQGDGNISIDAFSRIPLAADSASAFLRFPQRMSESMDNDHSAALCFARWPELRSPWLEDFHRGHKYAAVFGKFATFRDFFGETGSDGRLSQFQEGSYLTPFLVHSVARREEKPISRYVDYWRRIRQFEQAAWCRSIAELIRTGSVKGEGLCELSRHISEAGPDVVEGEKKLPQSTIDADLQSLYAAASGELRDCLLKDAPECPSLLIVNPQSFSRKAAIDWPASMPVPPIGDGVVGRQISEGVRKVLVELPPCGYIWLSGKGPADTPPGVGKIPTAEELTVRNDLFEVSLSASTGGIAQIRTYSRTPNRLSQQLAWRFPREKSLEGAGDEESTTWYSNMRLRESRVLCAGPALGAVETVGDLVDPTDGKVLCTYRQTVRVWRGLPYVDVDIELGMEKTPTGDPWTNYVAARFAFHDESMAISRSMSEGAHFLGDQQQRFESPSFIEIADEKIRATILTHGLPFHRKTGERDDRYADGDRRGDATELPIHHCRRSSLRDAGGCRCGIASAGCSRHPGTAPRGETRLPADGRIEERTDTGGHAAIGESLHEKRDGIACPTNRRMHASHSGNRRASRRHVDSSLSPDHRGSAGRPVRTPTPATASRRRSRPPGSGRPRIV